jgi:signal transduction histidine kinase
MPHSRRISSVTALGLLCCALVFAIVPPKANAQRLPAPDRSAEAGLPEIVNYSTSEMNFDASNSGMVRDARGILYVANFDYVLVFDGDDWRYLNSPDGMPVSSIALGPDNTMYLNTYRGFGRIVLDSAGSEMIELLSDRLPDSARPQDDLYSTQVTGNTVWFCSMTRLYSWDGAKVRVIEPLANIRRMQSVNGRLYLLLEGIGLHEVRSGRIVPSAGGSLLSDPADRLNLMLPAGNGRTLVHTPKAGWLFYDGSTLTPAWSAQVRARLPEDVYCSAMLVDSTFAIGTDRHGIYIIDRDGNIRSILDATNGLADEDIESLYQDNEHILWAAFDNGIARISLPSAASRYGRLTGLKGRITSMTRFKGSLFACGTQGVYRLKTPDFTSTNPAEWKSRFQVMQDLPNNCYDLQVSGSEMLVASTTGLFAYDGTRARRITNKHTTKLHPINESSDSVFVVWQRMDTCLSILSRRSGGWKLETILPDIAGWVISIAKTPAGAWWFGTYVQPGDGSACGAYTVGSVTRLGTAKASFHATPSDDYSPRMRVVVANGTPRFVTDEYTYLLDEKSGRLIPDLKAWKKFGFPPGSTIGDQRDLPDGSVWLQLHRKRSLSYGFYRANDTGTWDLMPLTSLYNQVTNSCFFEEDGIAWFGGDRSISRIDTRRMDPDRTSITTQIRALYRNDTIVYYYGNISTEKTDLVIDYYDEGVTVDFVAPTMHYPQFIEYRWKLDGLDDQWSEWSTRNTATFPALSEGSYTFHVESRLVDGTICDAASLRMRILPPWQRTWWAYGFYIVGFIGLFVLSLHFRTRRLEDRGRQLEQTVRERTEEISTQARKIRTQAEELETLDSIVRTVNKEVHLTDVLSALLQQTLLLFPQVDSAFYLQRSNDDGMFRLVASVGEPVQRFDTQAFTLSRLMDDASNSMQTIQDGVYVLRGLERFWNEPAPSLTVKFKAFMGMSDMQHGSLRGFLVLGSERTHTFSSDDLRRLLRLREHVSSAVAKALAIRELETKNQLLDQSNRQLRDMQQQLIVHEKLAALGELTAGIAHEIQNPLNFVNNFSSLSLELLDELEQDLSVLVNGDSDTLLGLIATVRGNCERIREHGMRATSIVRAMLMHTRKGSGRRETVTLNEFLDQFVLLSYHGMRMLHPEHDLRLHTDYDRGIVGVQLLPQEMSRVIVNVCNNAWESAIEKAGREPGGGPPEVHVRSVQDGDRVRITIRDNGEGIPQEMYGRIFEPFFTTKRSGNNAGLGLSMSYEIVTQLHRGRLTVQSEIGEYSEFIIDIPTDDEAAAEG